ncbi:hypothetical protein MSAN_00500200 [Mycena sanguinolenta]|uniref:Uncharacterized protein n=1 Tax=Mycena sanguinolenta TaxID=230812 RepID=A0A8H6Z961_9AGAR|nr:hypothetical protein MSAN_00500200 [Mycena sanguinolenta]
MYSTPRHAFLPVLSPFDPQLITPQPIRTFHQQERAGSHSRTEIPREHLLTMHLGHGRAGAKAVSGTPVEANTQKIRQRKSFSRIATQPNAILAIGVAVELRSSLAAHLCLRVEFARVTYCVMEVE